MNVKFNLRSKGKKMKKKLMISAVIFSLLGSSLSDLYAGSCNNCSQNKPIVPPPPIVNYQQPTVLQSQPQPTMQPVQMNTVSKKEPKVVVQEEVIKQNENNKENKAYEPFNIPKHSVEAEEITDNAFIVRPEITTIVKMSASDINRIVCSEGVKREVRVVHPKRKGVNVRVVDNNVFVEFEVRKKGNEYIYQKTPVELYVICDETVYNMIAFPYKIPAVTVYLENKAKSIKSSLEKTKEMPFEKRIVEIVSNVLTGKVPMEAVYKKLDKEYNIFPLIEMKEKANFVFEAEGLVARVFYLSLKPEANLNEVDVKEKDFLRKDLTVRPVAVALNKLKLRKGEKVMLVIVEKAPALGFSNNNFFLFD